MPKRWWIIPLALSIVSGVGAAPATQNIRPLPPDRKAAAKADAERAAAAKKAVAAQKAAAARVPAPVDFRQRSFEQQKQTVEKLATLGGQHRIEDLVEWQFRDGQLKASWTNLLTTTGSMKLDVPGSKAVWVLHRAQVSPHPAFPGGLISVNLARYEFDREDAPYQISLNIGPQYFNISAMYPPKSDCGTMNFSQNQNMTILNVTEVKNNRHQQVVAVNAPSFAELQAREPEAVRRYLGPVLRDLVGADLLRPGSADVYRVFRDIAADPAVMKKLQAILPDMDVADFKQRESASRGLAALGRPGVLAALRVDPETLTAEQRVRLADFVGQHSRRTIENAALMARDLEFLLDALEDDDPAVRRSAKASLEQVLGRPVAFDPSLTGEKLFAAALAARVAARQPATQPAPPRAGAARLGPVNH